MSKGRSGELVRVLVCGGRNYSDRQAVDATLDQLDVAGLIHGGASGADSLGEQWARCRGVPVEIYRADWQRYGRAAGPIRNQRMIDEGWPDLVVAFPGGKGTADMVQRAKDTGVRMMELTQ